MGRMDGFKLVNGSSMSQADITHRMATSAANAVAGVVKVQGQLVPAVDQLLGNDVITQGAIKSLMERVTMLEARLTDISGVKA